MVVVRDNGGGEAVDGRFFLAELPGVMGTMEVVGGTFAYGFGDA